MKGKEFNSDTHCARIKKMNWAMFLIWNLLSIGNRKMSTVLDNCPFCKLIGSKSNTPYTMELWLHFDI